MGMTFEQFIDNLKSAFNNANVDNVYNIVDNSTPDTPTAPLSVAPSDGGVSEGGAPDPSATNDNGDMIRTMIHEELLNIVQNMNKTEPTPAMPHRSAHSRWQPPEPRRHRSCCGGKEYM